MAPVAKLVSLSLVPALLPSSAAEGLFDAAPGCRALLRDIAAQGRSDLELAAFCRANLPPQLCRAAAGSLGSQPWSAERMASTCKRWEEQWDSQATAPGRAVLDFAELQAKTDECIRLKAEAGLCKDPKTGSPVSLDQCAEWKRKVYPEQTKKVQDMLYSFYGVWMGGQTPGQKSEALGPVARPAAGAGLFLGAAFAGAVFAGVAASVCAVRFCVVGLSLCGQTSAQCWRRRRTAEQNRLLVEGAAGSAAPSAA